MNTDKAYIMGLVVGGGCFSSNHKSFSIKLPYRQWGDYAKNPERAGMIANDILKVVKPLMSVEYNLDVSYTPGKEWNIVCHGDTTDLIRDLQSFHIEPTSDLHKTADLQYLIASFSDTNMKKRFIAGVADTIGSMAPSHRRFTDDVQIISFEISGFNYKYVCQLCNLLYQLGCVPDQILWQHPNMQSGTDSYYTSWKKGNKLRVTLDSFSTFGSLAFKSKPIASKENRKKEGKYNSAEKCENKTLSVPGVVAVHVDENYADIPNELRGGHFIHHKQICAALNCPHSPQRELDRLLTHAENYISPFTVLHKDTAVGVSNIITADPLLRDREYTQADIEVKYLVDAMHDGAATILFSGNTPILHYSRDKGYPMNVIMDAVAYIVASKTGNLNGKRPRGNREEIIVNAITAIPDFAVTVKIPDLLTPMVLTDGKVAALVGPLNAQVYRQLISYDPDNKYKMLVRKITENDLR